MMISSEKQLSPNQVIDISGFGQEARLPSNTNIQQVFGNCGQIQSIHHSVAQNNRHIFVVFDTIGAARAALQLKHESWDIQSLMRASEEVVTEFNRCIARSGWQSRSNDSDFGNSRPISPENRVVDLSADERYVGDNGWASRQRPTETPMDYDRPGSGRGPLPPQAYRGPPDPSFNDPVRDRSDMPPRDSLDGPRTRGARSPNPTDFRRPLSPPGRQGPTDSTRYGNASVTPNPRRGPAIDYPPSYGPTDRSVTPRDGRGPYPDERYRREITPPPPWTDSRRRPYEDSAVELEASNKRIRLNEGGDPIRSRPRDYPPVDPAASYRGAPIDPPYRQPPPRGPPDAYPPPPPIQYRSRTMDDQYPASSSARYGRDEPLRYRSSDDYDGQYRRVAGGPPYSTSSLESGPGYRSSGTPQYSGYSSPDSISSRGKPLPPAGRPPGPPIDYPATSYRVDERRGLADYRQPEEFSRRFVEPAPPSRMPRQEDARRGYMDSYPPPVVDDRRYDGRRYEARLPDGIMDRDYDRRGPSQYPNVALPPGARSSSPPRQSLASRLGMEPRGSAMEPPSGPRYRGGNDYDPMMPDAPPTGSSYRDDYRRLDDPRDRERFDDQRASSRAGFDLRDRVAYDSRDRDRVREVERERDRARERERDREYPDDRYRRDSNASQTRPFDRTAGTRVGGIHPADGTVIFVSNLPAQVSQPRFRRMFADAVGPDNVMDVNTGRAGFAFVRIRTRELAEEAVSKLHHVEFAPKYKMNVSIGKPPHEYRKWKNSGYHSSKRSMDNRAMPSGPGHGPESSAQPKQNANKKKKKNKKNNNGQNQAGGDKEKPDERPEGEGGDGDDSGDESSPGSDPDGSDIRHGDVSGAQMTQEEIEAFMENMAKEAVGDHSKDIESSSEHSGGPHATEGRRDLRHPDSPMRPNAFDYGAEPTEDAYRVYVDVEPHPEQRPYDSVPARYDSRNANSEPTGHTANDLKPSSSLGRNDLVDTDPDDAAVAEQLADLEARSAPSEV